MKVNICGETPEDVLIEDFEDNGVVPRVDETIEMEQEYRRVTDVIHGREGYLKVLTEPLRTATWTDKPKNITIETGDSAEAVGVMTGATVARARCPHCNATIENEPIENLDHDEYCPHNDE